MPQAEQVAYVVNKSEPSIENLVIPLGFVSEYLRIQNDFLRNLRLELCGDEVELYWPYSPALSQ
ncbi:hypothetical protein AAVH_13196 [Aphelenchoides avenae]|nr:hypothetical protein AAVH_13196 [Aphelenchus avenae]